MKKIVLVVEDDNDIQEYYKVILEDFSLELLFALDGEAALRFIDSNEKIDLILLDIVMPVMDGEKFLRILRHERKLDIPVIICTVDEVSASRMEKIAPVQGIYFKLSEIDDLIDMVRRFLAI